MKIIENIKAFFEAKIAGIKASIQGKIIEIVAKAISGVLILYFLLMFVMFFSLSLSLYLNHVLDSSFLGFVCVTGLYFLILAILGIMFSKGYLENKIKEKATGKKIKSKAEKAEDIMNKKAEVLNNEENLSTLKQV